MMLNSFRYYALVLALALAAPVALCAQTGKRAVTLVAVGTKEKTFVPPIATVAELPENLRDTAFGQVLPLVPTLFQGEMGCYGRYFTLVNGKQVNGETLRVKLTFSDIASTLKTEENNLGVKCQVVEVSQTMTLTVTDANETVLLSRNFTHTVKNNAEQQEEKTDVPEIIARRLIILNLRVAAKVIFQTFTCNYKIAIKALPKGSAFDPSDVLLFCDDEPVLLNESFRLAKGKHQVRFVPGQGYASQEIEVDLSKDSKTTFELVKE